MNTPANKSLTDKFLLIGKAEGYSYLFLIFIAMPLKYMADIPIAVRIAGSLHGILFIAFLYFIYKMIKDNKLTTESGIYAFLLSIIPFGTFFLRKLL